MFPLYDTVRSRRVPLVNLTLIAANILAFFYESGLDFSALREFVFEWGLIPNSLIIEPYIVWPTIFTSMFLHGGWFHILSNMWVLFIFGDNVEARMGGGRYLLFYLLSGIAAALLQSFILPTSAMPIIGASGAVAGVLGAYLILFPRARVASLVPILFLFTLVEIPAIIYLGFWFFSQLFSGWLSLRGTDSSEIAWWAHVGGFVFGLLAANLLVRRRGGYRIG